VLSIAGHWDNGFENLVRIKLKASVDRLAIILVGESDVVNRGIHSLPGENYANDLAAVRETF